MKYLKLFENFNSDYNISDKSYKSGSLGPEFDQWIKQCNKTAEENKWNNWEYQFSKENPKKIIFIVTERQFDSKNAKQKGCFDLTTKKGDFISK